MSTIKRFVARSLPAWLRVGALAVLTVIAFAAVYRASIPGTLLLVGLLIGAAVGVAVRVAMSAGATLSWLDEITSE